MCVSGVCVSGVCVSGVCVLVVCVCVWVCGNCSVTYTVDYCKN